MVMVQPSFPLDKVVNLIRAFAHLFRLPVGMLSAVAGCVTIFILDATTAIEKYGLTAIALLCMMSAACAINDYWDIEKDQINHPERPLPSGTLLPQHAWWAAISLFSLALIAAWLLGLQPFILISISVGLLWNYSHLLIYSGILGNVIVAIVITELILLGGLVVDRPLALLYPAWFLFCYALAKEIIWDVHDAEGDRQQGIVTIANQWGDEVAFAVAWGLLGGLLGSLPLAQYLRLVAHPLWFSVFALLLLVSLGPALKRYQHQRTLAAYQNFIGWERLSMVFGVFALFAAAPPL